MAKLSTHAKMRLRERFNASDDDIMKIGAMLSTHGKYTVSARSAKEEIRDIVYNGRGIRGVVKYGVVATCLTEWMDYYVEGELLDPKAIPKGTEQALYKTISSLRARIDYYETKPFVIALCQLIGRRYHRRKNERNKIKT